MGSRRTAEALSGEPVAPSRVTYVVGSSHSGSTLLAFLADQHPQMASVGETAVKSSIRRRGLASQQPCSCGSTIAGCEFWQAIFHEVSSRGIPFDAEHWTTDYRFEARWMDRLLTRETSSFWIRRARRWATRDLPWLQQRTAAVNRANVAFVRAVLALTGAHVFFDTTKLLTRLTYLLDIPDLRINVVRLVRDARGVAASAKRRGESVPQATSVWLNDQLAIDHFFDKQPALSPLLIRYEDLCDRPAQVLGQLWAFCGVEPIAPSTVVTPGAHHVLGNHLRLRDVLHVRLDDAWRATLDADDERAVWNATDAMSRRLGYAR